MHHTAIVSPSAAIGSSLQASLSGAAPLAAEARTPEDEKAVQHAFKNISHTFLAYHVRSPPRNAVVSQSLVTPSIVYAVTTSVGQGTEVPDESHAASESQGSATASVPVAASTKGEVASKLDLQPVKQEKDEDEEAGGGEPVNVVKESVCTDWPKDDDDSPGVDSRDVRMGVDALDDQDLSAESAATELKMTT